MEKVLTRNEIFALEAKAVERGDTIQNLMEKAGTAVFEEVTRLYKPCSVLIVCGSGNNGGDGFVVARLLMNAGWNVGIGLETSNYLKPSPDALHNKNLYAGQIIDFKNLNIGNYDLIVDALFGIGLKRNIEGACKDLIIKINDSNKPVVSIDIPSGIDCDTGMVLGAAIEAALTITFEYKKPAHNIESLKNYFGEVIVRKIGLSA